MQNGKLFILLLAIIMVCSSCMRYTGNPRNNPHRKSEIDWKRERVCLCIDSFPTNAKIYENGKYIGRTSRELFWDINTKDRAQGFVKTTEILLISEGYLPKRLVYNFDLIPVMKKLYVFHDLIVFEHDPNISKQMQMNKQGLSTFSNDKGPSTSSKQHLTIKQEESPLDQLKKLGEVGVLIRTLRLP